MYTVKEISELAGVSVRTLHYYHEIGLLEPSSVGNNGYRYYGDAELLRLQQILFFRELDFTLSQIGAILERPDFDRVTALQSHRCALQQKIARLKQLVATVDSTIMHLVEEIDMSNKKKIFEGFSEETQKEYEQEAIDRWGEASVRETTRRWNSYSAAEQEQIKAEGNAIYEALAAAMPSGPDSNEVQALLVRWHQHLRHFYEPSIEVLGGLGQLYNEDPAFHATFAAIDPALPGFLARAIALYVDRLETAWLERELGILEE